MDGIFIVPSGCAASGHVCLRPHPARMRRLNHNRKPKLLAPGGHPKPFSAKESTQMPISVGQTTVPGVSLAESM